MGVDFYEIFTKVYGSCPPGRQDGRLFARGDCRVCFPAEERQAFFASSLKKFEMNHQCRLIGSVKNKVMNMMLITFQKIICFKQIGSCSGYAESGRYIKNRGRGHLNLSVGSKLSPAATTGSPEPIRSDRCGFKFAVAASISGFDSWVLERLWRVNIFGAYAVSFCTSLVQFFWPFHLGSAIFRITVRENENDRPRKQFYIGFEENDVFFVNKIKLFI